VSVGEEKGKNRTGRGKKERTAFADVACPMPAPEDWGGEGGRKPLGGIPGYDCVGRPNRQRATGKEKKKKLREGGFHRSPPARPPGRPRHRSSGKVGRGKKGSEPSGGGKRGRRALVSVPSRRLGPHAEKKKKKIARGGNGPARPRTSRYHAPGKKKKKYSHKVRVFPRGASLARTSQDTRRKEKFGKPTPR